MSDEKTTAETIINEIIRESHKCFRTKEREGKSKSATITDIVKIIKREVKEYGN